MLSLMKPVLESLYEVHKQGLIHRDISPDNIMFDDDGSIKLIDFGAVRGSSAETEMTYTVMLKHGYAPQEQYYTKGNQGPWTDIYSLCATMYKMLTGNVPPNCIERMSEDTYIPPSYSGVAVSEGVEKALAKGLAVNIADRYQNIGELIKDLYGKEYTFMGDGQIGVTQPVNDMMVNDNKNVGNNVNGHKGNKKLIPVICGLAALLLICVVLGVLLNKKEPKDKPSTTVATATDATTEAVSETTTASEAQKPSSPAAASGLSAYATEYEGREQTSTYNYGEALQKSILFYDLQRTGNLPDNFRSDWRGDSCLNDGADAGLDLSGGFLDAGDNVKFNLPMSYTCTMLSWSVIEDYDSYKESGQLPYILDNIRWGNDYFMKCHPEANVYYYQVGDGGADHGFWGSAEVVEAHMKRPSYKVDMNNGGSTVAAGTAASLASAAVVFKDSDSAYSQECLKHAKELFSYAETVKSDSGYTAANGFYTSNSGYKDELAWSAFWLYKATGDNAYLQKSKQYLSESSCDFKWAHCWDDVSYGTSVLLAIETKEQEYKDRVDKHMNFWLNQVKYTPKGLAWLDQWGALRYATTTAYLALVYADSDVCPADKKETYSSFGKAQVDYALGSSGRSYVIGYGENSPKNPHHRTAHGAYSNNIGEPAETRHTLFGALVGGPDSNDNYTDDRNNYINNEVACDYNAGFTGLLAKMYNRYGGQTLVNFGAVEYIPENEELTVHAGINADGNTFTEIKAIVYNKTAWPARVTDKLVLRYFFEYEFSEISQKTGMSENAVRTSLSRTKEKLRDYLKEKGDITV